MIKKVATPVFLLCQPDYYGIYYEINPYMHVENRTNHGVAMHQWQDYKNLITQCGGEVKLIEPAEGLPDMVFTSNGGIVVDSYFIKSYYAFEERKGEEPYFTNYLQTLGYEIITQSKKNHYHFEGEAEIVVVDDKWLVGVGPRSEKPFYQNHPFFTEKNLVYCELKDPYFYHLDTCLLKLDDENALWYPDAFTHESQKAIAKHLKLRVVPRQEALNLVCNSVIIDNDIIMPSGSPRSKQIVQEMGFTVHDCEMGEFIKAGGACNCLCMHIN